MSIAAGDLEQQLAEHSRWLASLGEDGRRLWLSIRFVRAGAFIATTPRARS